ncbi:hypothetical protein KIL84_002330 [Mauremys mutica]|uniref:Uncharacterized protein n=1 Tax=Mauremys mutica TaxID=74926 RepID=A0A9D3X6L0_9SAUR|nr:hypothetical protein KIL84_002330 [Mauremys mutica]
MALARARPLPPHSAALIQPGKDLWSLSTIFVADRLITHTHTHTRFFILSVCIKNKKKPERLLRVSAAWGTGRRVLPLCKRGSPAETSRPRDRSCSRAAAGQTRIE